MDPFYLVAPAFFGILVIYLMWKLRNFMKLYAEFPSYQMLYHVATALTLRNTQLQIPLRDLFFQNAIKASEQFQKEGMFLALVPQPHLFIFSEETMKIFSNILDKPYKYEVMKDSIGMGLFLSDSKDWKKQHKMVSPAFHIGMLKRKLHIFNENSEILIKNLAESVNNPYIDILKYIQLCTFSIIYGYTLGLKADSPEEKELLVKVIGMVSDLSKLLADSITYPLYLYLKFIMNFTPSGWKQRKMINETKDIVKEVIVEMKRKVNQELKILDADNPDDVEETRKFFANILLDQHAKDPSFTMEDIENQVKTFLVGGFDTSSFSILWCLIMLALHPDIQDQVYKEIEFLPNGHIMYEDLLRLTYLECVIKETLRLLPPTPMYGRRTTKDIQCGKYVVPKGTSIIFFIYALHRNPMIFPEPETFNPDRFMDENIEKSLWSFIPFATGPRQCPGKKFAMLEMKVILADILRHFQIKTLDSLEEIGVTWQIFMAPAKSPRLLFIPRNGKHI